MTVEQIIVARLLRELDGCSRVALGSGIPLLAEPHLAEGIVALTPPLDAGGAGQVDGAAVEALEVSARGDLCVAAEKEIRDLKAERWIVATRHTRADGSAKIVNTCRLAVGRAGCVDTIITELGVIRVSDLGLTLTEVVPGVSSDDVKLRTAASLHIADDLRLVEL